MNSSFFFLKYFCFIYIKNIIVIYINILYAIHGGHEMFKIKCNLIKKEFIFILFLLVENFKNNTKTCGHNSSHLVALIFEYFKINIRLYLSNFNA